jgi:hypothetical protein
MIEMGMAASITWSTLKPEYAEATVKIMHRNSRELRQAGGGLRAIHRVVCDFSLEGQWQGGGARGAGEHQIKRVNVTDLAAVGKKQETASGSVMLAFG